MIIVSDLCDCSEFRFVVDYIFQLHLISESVMSKVIYGKCLHEFTDTISCSKYPNFVCFPKSICFMYYEAIHVFSMIGGVVYSTI